MDDIRYETGYKDDYKVVVDKETPWSPTNEEIFELIDLWFESEEYEFGAGYGKKMPWFYICLIMIDRPEKAKKAYELRGWDSKNWFETCVQNHADEIIEILEDLKKETS